MTTPASEIESIHSQLEEAERRLAELDQRLGQLRAQQTRLRRNKRNLNLERIIIEYRIRDTGNTNTNMLAR